MCVSEKFMVCAAHIGCNVKHHIFQRINFTQTECSNSLVPRPSLSLSYIPMQQYNLLLFWRQEKKKFVSLNYLLSFLPPKLLLHRRQPGNKATVLK